MMAFALINTWNEFLFALTLVPNQAQKTFPPAIQTFTSGFEYVSDTSPGGQAVYLLLPIFVSAILISLTVKQFTTAVAGGATKG
jgi:ABC-type glycerol-3-phosphate transport system permease component